jgi:hypothetical protein
MKRDLYSTKPLTSSFLSCEKDTETILRKLFVECRPYSNDLKRLLVIPNADCLANRDNAEYQEVDKMSIKTLVDEGFIILSPKIEYKEHDPVQARMVLSFNNFIPNDTNPEFRDCTVSFDIICHTDYWDIGNFRIRPLKIAGIIDGILNNNRLTGIGTFQFMGCNELVLNEDLSGYTLMFRAIHQTDGDDKIKPEV